MLNQSETDCRVVCFTAFWAFLMKYVKPVYRSEEVSLFFQSVLLSRLQEWLFVWRITSVLFSSSREEMLGKKGRQEM